MYKFSILIFFILIFSSCKKKQEAKEASTIQNEIITLNYNELKPFLHKKDDKTYVINFWATWCLPCVKE